MKGNRHAAPNNRMRSIAGQTKKTGGVGSGPHHAKSLTGVTMDGGLGTRLTNTSYDTSISTRGMKEAMNPKGPHGSE